MEKDFPKRMRSVENAKGFNDFWKQLELFMLFNNFLRIEIQSVLHLINSFYFMGNDVENSTPLNGDNKGQDMDCEKCRKMTDCYLKTNPHKKGYVLCESCYEKSKEYFVYLDPSYQPERSKREDSCKHEWGSEEHCDSSDPFYLCNKCGHEMRCSEHSGD